MTEPSAPGRARGGPGRIAPMPARDASPLPDPAARPRQARRPRSSTSERSALLRRDLMEGELYEKAAQLFAEKGFAGTTLQDIANAMGVSRPSLYHYIKSKDELLERLAQDVTAAAVAVVSEIAGDDTLTAPEKLHLTTRRMIEFIAAKPLRFRLLNQSESAMPEDLAATQSRLGRRILKGVIAIIDEGQRAGVFRPLDPRVAALGIIGTWNWVAWWHSGATSASPPSNWPTPRSAACSSNPTRPATRAPPPCSRWSTRTSPASRPWWARARHPPPERYPSMRDAVVVSTARTFRHISLCLVDLDEGGTHPARAGPTAPVAGPRPRTTAAGDGRRSAWSEA